MATRIAQRELRNNNTLIVDRVEAGESFVVTRNGIAVADLVPHSGTHKPPRFPRTTELVANRRRDNGLTVDREAWVRDIRDTDRFTVDDPFGRGV